MAANHYFLKIEGVEGESRDASHKGEIEVDVYNVGLNHASAAKSGGGMGTGKAEFQDISFTIKTSKASPKLFLACANGTYFPKAVLACRRHDSSDKDCLRFTLHKVQVSSFHVMMQQKDHQLFDIISLNFSKIESEYNVLHVGAVRVGYDLEAQKKL